MSKLESSPKFSAHKQAGLIHDVFRWSKGDTYTDWPVIAYLGSQFGESIDLTKGYETRFLAIRAVAKTFGSAKFHYDTPPSPVGVLKRAKDLVIERVNYLELIAENEKGIVHIPPNLGAKLLGSDVNWLPRSRAEKAAIARQKNERIKPALDRPYTSNLIAFGILGYSTGQHKEQFGPMFKTAAGQVLFTIRADDRIADQTYVDLMEVKAAHLSANPHDEAKLREHAPELFGPRF